MRLDDADREQLFDKLSRHHALGRLDLPELERRVAAVAAAETREQAALVMADLPVLPGEPGPTRGTRPRPPRGHGQADRPGPDWRATNERFRDPRTNRVMRVWEDAAGARHYVPDDPS